MLHQKCGVSFRADLRVSEWRYVASKGYQEPDTEFFFSRYLSPSDIVVDVGAYIGNLSIIAAIKVGPEGQVHAFEPHPRNAELIQLARASNGLTNLVVNQVAVGEESGKSRMVQPLRNSAYIRFVINNPILLSNQAVASAREVEMVTLDGYFESAGIMRCDLIKVDVDGPELAVLRGAQRLIHSYKPALVVEVGPYQDAYGYSFKDIDNLLRSEGYAVCAFSRIGPTTNGMRYVENLQEATFDLDGNLFAWPASADVGRIQRLGYPATWLQQFGSW
jgi:FkbM family methyltransferase